MTKAHSFHIPVMGTSFSVDTPLKVSHLGIDSVISIVDDFLLEKLRKMYCGKFEIPYEEISEKIDDFRAKRITSYLNLINKLAEEKFEKFKNTISEKGTEIKSEYFHLLPDTSSVKEEFNHLTGKYFNFEDIKAWIKDHLSMGSIDVNIMTKVDKDNYRNGEKLPPEYNDALAAFRGFANSDLQSSVILSAGMNPRLYAYMEQFKDFYPDENGEIKKKIVLKVSDYRSAMIQGKFLAKKGLWVSEYRIESGLNCGGHAFATDGILLGPVLAEFRDNRKELSAAIHEVLVQTLSRKGHLVPKKEIPLKITAQGGVGTAEEHQFLIDHYEIDSVGWGTPFLLVPEATTVDEVTLQKLADAKEEDLYLSYVSPLGVPFNNLRGNTRDEYKYDMIEKGKPGSYCPKKLLVSNKEFTEKAICTASMQYQRIKLKELKNEGLPLEKYQTRFNKIVEKTCLCLGLAAPGLLVNDVEIRKGDEGALICPGPNLAYFSKILSLKEMVDHIYGRANVISRTDRPHMFVKELYLYIDFLKTKIEETKESMTIKQEKYLFTFIKNLREGIAYYHGLFESLKDKFEESKSNIIHELEDGKEALFRLFVEIEDLQIAKKLQEV
ncbi:MAG: hypothetical protein GXO89_10130 [Chlorobi bacterium]|nr:hypothetical protein [Chlorobiota bacterium]